MRRLSLIKHTIMIAVLPALLAFAAFEWLQANPQLIENTGIRSFWLLATLVVFLATLPGLIWAWMIAARRRRDIDAISVLMEAIEATESADQLSTIADPDMHLLGKNAETLRQKLMQAIDPAYHLNLILDSVNDAIFVSSADGVIRRANSSACNLVGYEEQELLGMPIQRLVSPDRKDAFPLDATTTEATDTVLLSRDGSRIPVSVTCSVVSTADPRFKGNIYIARNISDRKRAEKRIRYLARYDALTRIPNRMQFQHLLQRNIARAKRSKLELAMLYLDMDQFKEVNDTFGHAAGDQCLEIIAQRLQAVLGENVVIGRLAGDEFGIVLEGFANDKEARYRASDVARLILDRINNAFYIQDSEVFITATIGIACYPRDADNVIDIIRNADAAMYHAKQNGGNTGQLYLPEMNAAAVERLMLKSKLRKALERKELIVRYLPKIDLRNGKIAGAEALLRWRLPGHGDIAPSQFIPLAEEGSMISEIGDWVLRKVCNDYKHWQEYVPSPGRIAVNLSLRQLMRPGVSKRFRKIFRETQVSPTALELELTETTLMHDSRRIIRILDDFCAMGLHLAIDDFGTGYSSLSALKDFPISTLKIDQSFVRNADVDSSDAAMVKTIIEMGRNLDLEVVAEGVENQAQLELLRLYKCTYAQGHLFGEAMSAKKFLDQLIAQNEGTKQHQALFA
ncbi:MAG: EAL domain-containing protein [Proteobacteria bacterium]|nr:EAL domain-containing protein [Pseudomonadota bacterium]